MSEYQLQCKLSLTRRADDVRDSAGVRIGDRPSIRQPRVQGVSRKTIIRMVEGVEEFPPELDPESFRHLCIFQQCEVGVVEMRTSHRVPNEPRLRP